MQELWVGVCQSTTTERRSEGALLWSRLSRTQESEYRLSIPKGHHHGHILISILSTAQRENLQIQESENSALQTGVSELQTEVSELQTEMDVIRAELELLREELQLYHDTGITVAQGIVPFYRKQPYGSYALKDNQGAINVSWYKLKDFLKDDRTDSNPYIDDV